MKIFVKLCKLIENKHIKRVIKVHKKKNRNWRYLDIYSLLLDISSVSV